jgi:putative transposase
LGISRASYYYKAVEHDEDRDVVILEAILDELRNHPFYGYRKIAYALKDLGVSRKQVRRIMHKAGLRAIYPKRRTSIPAKYHKKYPYLLKGLSIWLPNQVWATDITYIKLAKGFVYLVVIFDLYSRKILSWKVSNTMDTAFCIACLEEAIRAWGIPAIFNTDQGSQFTSEAFITVLESYGIRISMDSKNRALDNIYIERVWRTIKYEDIYINDYQTMEELKSGLQRYVYFYNNERYHQSLDYRTPNEIYDQAFIPLESATRLTA